MTTEKDSAIAEAIIPSNKKDFVDGLAEVLAEKGIKDKPEKVIEDLIGVKETNQKNKTR